MTRPPFAHWLPQWAIRTVPCSAGDVAVMVMLDGTIVTGFESTGADVFGADNARLNKNAGAVRRALNALPPGAFLQAEWHTGAANDALIADFAERGTAARGVLLEQRRQRERTLRADPSLMQGRLRYFIGQSRALGLLGPHRASAFMRTISRARDPQTITPADFRERVERVAETALRACTELQATGAELRPLNANALLQETHHAINPATSRRTRLTIVDRPEELPEVLTRTEPYLIHRPLTLREQLPLGDLTWSESTFTVDDPPILHRALSLERLPAFTRPDLLMGIQFRTNARFRLVTTCVATDRQELTEKLTRKRNIAHAQAGGVVRDVAANVAFSEYERVLETMLTNDQRVFAGSVTVIVDAPSQQALDAATRDLKDGFSAVGAALTTEEGRQLPAFLGALPGNGMRAPKTHQLTTNNAADLIPYFAPSAGDDDAQLLYHTRQNTLRKLSFLPSSARANQNVIAFGGSGSGKSFNVASIFEQACLVDGGPLLVIDVQGPELSSYRVLAEALGGSYVALSASADIAFNPFFPHSEIKGPDAAFEPEALRYLADLVALMTFADLERRADRSLVRHVARECVVHAYAATAAESRTPIISDVVRALATYEPVEPEYAPLAREMFLSLNAWTKEPTRARLLDRETRLPGARQMQVFDLFGLEKDKELAM